MSCVGPVSWFERPPGRENVGAAATRREAAELVAVAVRAAGGADFEAVAVAVAVGVGDARVREAVREAVLVAVDVDVVGLVEVGVAARVLVVAGGADAEFPRHGLP